MNRFLLLSLVILASGVGAMMLSTKGESQPTAKALVVLQPSTPGTAQSGHSNITGTAIAGQHVGGGAGLTALNADNIATGTLNDSRIPNNIVRTGQTQTITGNKVFSGLVTFTAPAAPFQVSSTGIVTNLNADMLDGQEGAFYRNVTNISSGLLGPAFGGTGLDTSATPAGSVLYTSSTGTWSTLAPGSNGQVLKLASGFPAWGDNTISGTASGDLSGTYPNPLVIALRGRNVSASAPSSGNVLKWNGSAWAPQSDNDSGLTLPFDGSASTLSNVAALKVSNTAASGTTYGVWTENASTSGTALLAYATAASGFTTGVLGRSDSPDGRGLHGFASSATGTNYGVYGRSDSIDGTGVFGWATSASNGTGVHGRTSSHQGVGVRGEATSDQTGPSYGGSFSAEGPDSYGVFGVGATGVRGVARPVTGVFGGTFESTSLAGGIGVFANGNLTGVYGISTVSGGRGGDFSGSTGVRGTSSSGTGGEFTGGTGVIGTASPAIGWTTGGKFTGGIGVWGTGSLHGVLAETTGPGGQAVRARATGPSGIAGDFFSSEATGIRADGYSYGVMAYATSITGIGGQFEGATGIRGKGIAEGEAAVYGDGHGLGFGGVFESYGGQGIYASTDSGTALFANSNAGDCGRFSSYNGIAVNADSFGDDAVVAKTNVGGRSGIYAHNTANSGAGYGVYGQSNSAVDGFGVYSAGRLGASGTKLFRIDHPFDPENKYLQHYCAEGPEPLNVYTGNIVTDAKGAAWVNLPDYFAEINRDFRYTLTVVDDTDSDTFIFAKVAKEIVANRFKIRTSQGHVKVSWRVEGVRNDRWMQVHGAPVEVQKPEEERGTYQHPELYGLPADRGVHYNRMLDDQKRAQQAKAKAAAFMAKHPRTESSREHPRPASSR